MLPETAAVWTEAPPALAERVYLDADDLVFQLEKQLRGRRAAGKHGGNFVANELAQRRFEQYPRHPQFQRHGTLKILAEVHMDDMHTTAPSSEACEAFVKDLYQSIKLKCSGLATTTDHSRSSGMASAGAPCHCGQHR